ncbi:MAG TPA: DUF3048 domain-containing protein [Candidatus Saccharimonadales bacterium]
MDNDIPRHNKFTRAIIATRAFINRHRIATLLISGSLAIAVVGNLAMALIGEPLPQVIHDIVIKKKEVYYAPLTGLKVSDKSDATKPVTAIIIENSPDARPQSGIKQAEIVYEAIAEGGITRFMALYQQNKPNLIGPVRSIRPYYVDWYAPYDASMAHVGGSAKALKMIRSGDYRDLDQFFNDSTYWRATDRYAPHNVYTNFKRLDKLNKAKKYTSSQPKVFERTDEEPAKKPNTKRISIHISSPLFDSSYSYDAGHNRYIRSQAGAQHKDREKGVITPKVVIVLKVDEETVIEETARQSIKTIGKGDAVIFQNGTAIKATWQRSSRIDQLKFIDKAGEEIKLARGQTWITAIDKSEGSVTWK